MKAYKTKKMSDLSIYLMSLIASGLFLWVIYGFINSDPVIIGANAAGLALSVSLLVMKLRYDKMQNSTVKITYTINQPWCEIINLIQYFRRAVIIWYSA